MWVRFTGPSPVESLKLVTPHRVVAQLFICSYFSEVAHRHADIPVCWRGKRGGVVGVGDRTGAVQSPPHPVHPLLSSAPHWGAIVGSEVHLICQDRAVSLTAVHILSPEGGIPGPAYLQIQFFLNMWFQLLYDND